MKPTLLALALIFFSPVLFADEKSSEEPKAIFNGKDLTGWKVPENNIWWLVNDGILQVRSGPKKKGGILWTEKEYGDKGYQGQQNCQAQ